MKWNVRTAMMVWTKPTMGMIQKMSLEFMLIVLFDTEGMGGVLTQSERLEEVAVDANILMKQKCQTTCLGNCD